MIESEDRATTGVPGDGDAAGMNQGAPGANAATGTVGAGFASREARKWAAICHLVALVGLLGNGIGFLVGPLAVWLVKRADDPLIDEQGKEAVNFQLTMFLGLFVSFLLVFVLIGIPMLIAVGLMMVIFPIIAAVKTSDGERYRYPINVRFIS